MRPKTGLAFPEARSIGGPADRVRTIVSPALAPVVRRVVLPHPATRDWLLAAVVGGPIGGALVWRIPLTYLPAVLVAIAAVTLTFARLARDPVPTARTRR